MQTGEVRDLFEQCKEVQHKKDSAILRLKGLGSEIYSEIERRGLVDNIHNEVFEIPSSTDDVYDIEDSITCYADHVELVLTFNDYYDHLDYDWRFIYYKHWDGLSIPEIVDEIVDKSNKLDEEDKEREFSSLEDQAKIYGYKLVKIDE